MGEAKNRQMSDRARVAHYPTCCYCDGPNEGPDHLPPRVFFYDRTAPEECVFPACSPCNERFRYDDIAIAFLLSRSAIRPDRRDVERRDHFYKRLRQEWPDLISEWRRPVGFVERKRAFREMFGHMAEPFRSSGCEIIEIGDITTAFLERTAIRFAKALFLRHTGRRLTGGLQHSLIPALHPGSQDLSSILDFLGFLQTTHRGKVDLSGQFQYRYNVSAEHGAFAAVISPGGPLLFQVIALEPPLAARLEAALPEIPGAELLKRITIA